MTTLSLQKIEAALKKTWSYIPPGFPFKALAAVNPLMGFQDLPFEEALLKGYAFFKYEEFPPQIQEYNRQTIKLCQILFDRGHGKIPAPYQDFPFLDRAKKIIVLDKTLHKNLHDKLDWLGALPNTPKACTQKILSLFSVSEKELIPFLNHLVGTLPGWASYVQHLNWNPTNEKSENDWLWSFTAFRLVIAYLMNIPLKAFLNLKSKSNTSQSALLKKISQHELRYQKEVIPQIHRKEKQKNINQEAEAQFVFCIDTRSEPMRRALEAEGIQTLGMAGFFGFPGIIYNTQEQELSRNCPIIVSPQYKVLRKNIKGRNSHREKSFFKTLYHSLKYNFTTPFFTAEALGPYCGIATFLKNIFPGFFKACRDKVIGPVHFILDHDYDLTSLTLKEKTKIAKSFLKTVGIKNPSPYVVFVGHGSQTENNAYDSFLQCGACGGNPGNDNAQIMAQIMNDEDVKKSLNISKNTLFLSALHDTTQEAIILHGDPPAFFGPKIRAAEEKVRTFRKKILNNNSNLKTRSEDWSQVRPEWGQAKNAFFFIGLRDSVQHIDFEGRAFLHSYDWSTDLKGNVLESIMLGPLTVGHWINSQYLFSTLDNVTFGGGSKVTKNLTGKLGFMQGNASDLMHGLPLQSLFIDDHTPYHEPIRLNVCIEAPQKNIVSILTEHIHLKTLVTNQWIHLFCYCPDTKVIYKLEKNLKWSKFVRSENVTHS